ncbi:DUF945 family protein [Thiofilum flexile]|uniref:DUF945 family protein n=1 Tax=Thiofilum flexile TaxID=125627 RepID=UPI00035F4017|nr:DUF945 family protein [Thiofilum flexile]
MNKLALVAAVLGALGAGWAGSTWYVGQQTEALLQAQIAQMNQMISQTPQLAGMKLELADYQKSFRAAQGKVKVNLPTNVGEDMPQAVNILLDIHHGPLLWSNGAPNLALSHIQSRLDESSFSEESQKKIKSLFDNKAPVIVDADLKFNNSADYTVAVNPLSYDDAEKGAAFNFAGLKLTGSAMRSMQGEKTVLEGPLSGKIGKIELKGADDFLMLLPESELAIEAKGIVGGELLNNTVDLTMPGISIKSKDLPEPISFGLALNSTQAVKDTDSEGKFGLTITDLMTPLLPISNAKYQFNFSGFNTAGLKAAGEAFSALEPVQNELRLLDEMSEANQTGSNSETVTSVTESPDAEMDEPASTTAAPDDEVASTETTTAPAEGDTTEGVTEGQAVSAVPEEQAPPDTPTEEEVLVEEAPEVQAKRAELKKQQSELMTQAFDVVLSKVLQADKSRIQQDINVENKLGVAHLDLDLNYKGNQDKQPITVELLQTLEPKQLLQLVSGKVNFNFDRDLFPMATLFLEQPFINKENNKYTMNLELAGDKLVLNNKAMSVEEFMALLTTASNNLSGGDEEDSDEDTDETTTSETPSSETATEPEDNQSMPAETAPAETPKANN